MEVQKTTPSENLSFDQIIVTGGRNFNDQDYVWRVLSKIKFNMLIHGACLTGADAHAHEYAVVHKIQEKSYPAQWKKYGRQAGPIRNSSMVFENKSAVVIAFPGGNGTADCVKKAQANGLNVIFAHQIIPCENTVDAPNPS